MSASPVSVVDSLDIQHWLREEWEKLKIAKKRLALQREKVVLDKEILRAERRTLRTQQALFNGGKLVTTSNQAHPNTVQNRQDRIVLSEKFQVPPNEGRGVFQKAGDEVQEQPEQLILKAPISSSTGSNNSPKLYCDKPQNSESHLEERVQSLEKENHRLRDENKDLMMRLGFSIQKQIQEQQEFNDTLQQDFRDQDPKISDEQSQNDKQQHHIKQQTLLSELRVEKEALLEQQVHQTSQIQQLQLERDKALQGEQDTKQNLKDKIAELAGVEKAKQELESAIREQQRELNGSKILVELYKRFYEDSRKKKEETQNDLESLRQFHDEQQELLNETREALLEERVNRMDEIQQQEREIQMNQTLQETIKENKHLEKQIRDQQQELAGLKLLAQKNYEQLNDDLKSLQKRRDKQQELLAEVQGTADALATAPVIAEQGSQIQTPDVEHRLRQMEKFERYLQNTQEEFDVADEDEEYIEEIIVSEDDYLEIFIDDEDPA